MGQEVPQGGHQLRGPQADLGELIGAGHGVARQGLGHPALGRREVDVLAAAAGDQDAQRQAVVVDGRAPETRARRVDVEREQPGGQDGERGMDNREEDVNAEAAV